MTLILTCLSRRFVLQVSDRRVVFAYPNGKYQLKEDDNNKALLIGRSLIFAYTGLAHIEGKESLLWLMEVLKPFADRHQIREGIFEAMRRASAYFKTLHLSPELRRHTFIGAGWMRNRLDQSIFPMAMRLTNAYDDSFRPLLGARDEFIVYRQRLRRLSGVSLLSDGARVRDSILLRCSRMLRRSYFLSSPLKSAQLLAREVRSIALSKEANGTVGRNLTVTCLPRNSMRNSSTLSLGPPNNMSPSTFYVLATGTKQILRSPALLKPGFPGLVAEVGLEIPPPADESDPYLGWR